MSAVAPERPAATGRAVAVMSEPRVQADGASRGYGGPPRSPA